MSPAAKARNRVSNPWPAYLGALGLLLAASGCSIEVAHGSPRRATAIDAGATTEVRESSGSHRGGAGFVPAKKGGRPYLVGLTRAQVKKRLGSPTEERNGAWVYTPEQPGCREEVVSEVVTFKDDVVIAVDLQRVRTNKVCRDLRRDKE